LRINVTMDEALVARVDRFAGRVHSSRSAILARGARLVLAAEMAEQIGAKAVCWGGLG
jgi:metal-responsive CopG/Arc/MetJ family transcriptional regulator